MFAIADKKSGLFFTFTVKYYIQLNNTNEAITKKPVSRTNPNELTRMVPVGKPISPRMMKMKSMFERAKNDETILNEWYKLFELQFSVINPFEVQAIKKHLSDFKVGHFVDVGFGSGDLTVALKKDATFSVDGLEPEKYFYGRTLAKFPDSDVNFLNIPLAAYKRTADCLFFRFVFQHYPDKNQLCRDASRLLSQKGIAIVVESFSTQTTPVIKSYTEISAQFVKFYKRGHSSELEIHTTKSFIDAGFRLARRALLKLPIQTVRQKENFAKMLFNAGLVKAITSNQNLSAMSILQKELKCLHNDTAQINYHDIVLIFEKL